MGLWVLMPTHILSAIVLEVFVYKEIEGTREGWESCQTGLKMSEREGEVWMETRPFVTLNQKWSIESCIYFLEATDLGIRTPLVT